MTTKEYLNQIGKLTFMIEAKFEELYRLQTLACRVTVATDGERVKSSPDPDRMADAVEKIIKCEEELNVLIKRTVNQRSQIIKMIDTPADINLYKRVRAICRGGLDSRLIDGKAAPVGAIFYAKAKEGYQETQNIIHTYENKGGSVAALPDFGSFAALPDENGGK